MGTGWGGGVQLGVADWQSIIMFIPSLDGRSMTRKDH